jgi:hypothetical protein
MPITINGSGSIAGLNAGGLPSGSITADNMASSLDLSSKTVSLGITSGANLIRIADTGTVTSGSSLTIDNCFSTTYNLYQVNVFCLGNTNENTRYALNYRTGGASGSDYSSNYTWRRYRNFNGHTTLEIDAATGDSSFEMNFYNRADYGIHVSAWVYMPANSSYLTNIWGEFLGVHPSTSTGFPHSFAGINSAFNTFTGIRFFARSSFTGSFTNARMIVYALRN